MLFAETEKRIDKNGAMQAHRFCNRSSVERHETGNAAIWLFVKFVDNEGVLFDGKKKHTNLKRLLFKKRFSAKI
jgi:hypothetical protein